MRVGMNRASDFDWEHRRLFVTWAVFILTRTVVRSIGLKLASFIRRRPGRPPNEHSSFHSLPGKEDKLKIAIIGSGAMGSLFGALLSPVADVRLIGHFKEHIRAVNENGLVVEKTDGSSETRFFRATDEPETLGADFELAIILTKSHGTEAAARAAKPLLGKEGLALTLQNGLGNMEVIADVMGEHRAVGGVTSHGATLLGPGRVRHAGMGPTHMAGPSARPDSLAKIVEVFAAAGIDARLSDNLDALIWGKLLINVGINALSAILRVQNGVLGVTPECLEIMTDAVAEAVAVAEALGVEPPPGNPMDRIRTVCANTAANRASMLQDILRGALTEVGVINGAIVRMGRDLGVATPCNAFLCSVIAALEATSEARL